MRVEYVVVVCRTAKGAPTAPVFRIEVTEEEYELGYHYDSARDEALGEGYENVVLSHCFDNSEHNEIIRTAAFLENIRAGGLVD
jgi:hypothetical protein